MYRPIAYSDRKTFHTLCPTCAAARFGRAVSDPSLDPDDVIGEIYRHDLETGDVCPCDVCGAPCAPDNVETEDGR